ncbi:MAG: threonylcarbamoyl-AMP synthase [Clostridia bacterium]|nr:threonylcarbamoyl-AMP synthase [Clostridia bacterium]
MNYYFDWKDGIKEDELNIAIEELKNGKLLLVPTETVYGIAANAYLDDACRKIFDAKKRPQDNPLIVHVSDKGMISEIAEEPNEIEKELIDNFMPGPFTLILNKKKVIGSVVSANMNTIGIRMPSNEIVNRIIKKSRIPIAAPSANVSGRPSGTCVEDVIDELKEKMDVIIDGGKCKIGIESTVVKVIDGVPMILRPGYITEQDIERVAGSVRLSDKLFETIEGNDHVESPGMKYRHYAPKTKCILVEYGDNQINRINEIIHKNNNVCVLGYEEDKSFIEVEDSRFINLGSRNDLKKVSQNVFSALRNIDKIENCELAIVEGIEKKGLGLSIMNRLSRACEN